MSDPTNGNGLIQPVRSCHACGGDVDLALPHRALRQMVIQGHPSPSDPIVGYIHEACALKRDLEQVMHERAQMGILLVAVVMKLGGDLRVHKSDIQRAAQSPDIDINEEPGGWLTLATKRVVLS